MSLKYENSFFNVITFFLNEISGVAKKCLAMQREVLPLQIFWLLLEQGCTSYWSLWHGVLQSKHWQEPKNTTTLQNCQYKNIATITLKGVIGPLLLILGDSLRWELFVCCLIEQSTGAAQPSFLSTNIQTWRCFSLMAMLCSKVHPVGPAVGNEYLTP